MNTIPDSIVGMTACVVFYLLFKWALSIKSVQKSNEEHEEVKRVPFTFPPSRDLMSSSVQSKYKIANIPSAEYCDRLCSLAHSTIMGTDHIYRDPRIGKKIAVYEYEDEAFMIYLRSLGLAKIKKRSFAVNIRLKSIKDTA